MTVGAYLVSNKIPYTVLDSLINRFGQGIQVRVI